MAVILEQCVRGLDPRGDAQFLGASEGVLDVDRAIIAAHAGPMVTVAGYDRALTVFALPYERLAVMMTFEDTDRSGRGWPYNHVIIISRGDYEGLGANPFQVARAGLFAKTKDLSRKLPALRLEPPGDAPQPSWRDAAPGEAWPALVSTALARSRTYVLLMGRRDELAEAVLLCLPLRQRVSFAFTTCLRSPKEKSREQLARLGGGEAADSERYEVRWCLVPLPADQEGARQGPWAAGRGETTIDLRDDHPRVANLALHPYGSLVGEVIAEADRPTPLVQAADGPLAECELAQVAAAYPFLDDILGEPDAIASERFLRACAAIRASLKGKVGRLGTVLLESGRRHLVAARARESFAALADELTTLAGSGDPALLRRAAEVARAVAHPLQRAGSSLLDTLAEAVVEPVAGASGSATSLFAQMAQACVGVEGGPGGGGELEALLDAALRARRPDRRHLEAVMAYLAVAARRQADPRQVAGYAARAARLGDPADEEKLLRTAAHVIVGELGAATEPRVLASALCRLVGTPANDAALDHVLTELASWKASLQGVIVVHEALQRCLVGDDQQLAADTVVLRALALCRREGRLDALCPLLRGGGEGRRPDRHIVQRVAAELSGDPEGAAALAAALHLGHDDALLLDFLEALLMRREGAALVVELLAGTVCSGRHAHLADETLYGEFRELARRALEPSRRTAASRRVQHALHVRLRRRVVTPGRVALYAVAVVLLGLNVGLRVWLSRSGQAAAPQAWPADSYDVLASAWYRQGVLGRGEQALLLRVSVESASVWAEEILFASKTFDVDALGERAAVDHTQQFLADELSEQRVCSVNFELLEQDEPPIPLHSTLRLLAVPVLEARSLRPGVVSVPGEPPALRPVLRRWLVRWAAGLPDTALVEHRIVVLADHGRRPLGVHTYHHPKGWRRFWRQQGDAISRFRRVVCRFTTHVGVDLALAGGERVIRVRQGGAQTGAGGP